MELYQSHKKVRAAPMTRGDYNELRGWRVPADEDAEDPGYLVEYIGSPSNKMPEPFENYISWCPKAEFESGNTLISSDAKVRVDQIDSLMESLEYKFKHVEETTITGCWAVLPNGFVVGYGQAACIDPVLFNKEVGESIALTNCKADANKNLWQFEGYKLASQ